MISTASTDGDEVVLFDYWRSSASYRVRIALGLKGVAYRSVHVDLLSGAHRSDEHLKRNPMGAVPALQIDGLMLTQSLAIIEYLEETRPEPPLLPVQSDRRAAARAAADAIAMEIHPICNLSTVTAIADLTGGDAEAKAAVKAEWMKRWIERGLGAVEAMVARRPGAFPFTDAPGVFECCLAPQLYNARRWGADLAATPRLLEIDAACAALPAFAAAHPDRFKPTG